MNPFAFFADNSNQEADMATTSRGRAQDRKLVAGGQDHEVQYESDKTGASKDMVKKTVDKVGNSREKVEAKLKK
jgi:hypothetical protein